MNTSNKPVSEIIKSKDVDEPKKRSREDWRKAKELEEARKAGTAPAAVDEEGKDINPHIPQYIASAPWYFGARGPTLKHQRPQPEKEKHYNRTDDYYTRGLKKLSAIKYRKGACENCGAMTHAKKDCMERPRRVGARYTGDAIAPDEEMLPELNLDYDGKRDRWNGYDSSNYQSIVEEYAKVEEAKRQLKEERLKQDLISGDGSVTKELKEKNMMGAEAEKSSGAASDEDDDDDRYADNADMPGTKVDSKQRITVRNLRIREDIAKYLRNLDPNSAYYDPKTRSMRDNPYKTSGKTPEELQYAGENFIRFTGDTVNHAESQLFAWQAYDKGVDVHLQAEPTKAELLNQEFLVKKDEFKYSMKSNIVEKYGGEEHLQAPPKEMIFAQTEDYVEYSRHGTVVRGTEKPIVRSKYEEDLLISNHLTVWGSYWKDGRWGYKCCHSFVKNSYCTGDSGKELSAQVSLVSQRNDQIMPSQSGTVGLEQELNSEEKDAGDGRIVLVPHQEGPSRKRQKKIENKKARRDKNRKKHSKDTSPSAESQESESSDEDIKREWRLKKALEAEEENRQEAERILAMDERKRPYNSMYEVKAPTEEEMEAYFLKRQHPEDPMAAFLGKN